MLRWTNWNQHTYEKNEYLLARSAAVSRSTCGSEFPFCGHIDFKIPGNLVCYSLWHTMLNTVMNGQLVRNSWFLDVMHSWLHSWLHNWLRIGSSASWWPNYNIDLFCALCALYALCALNSVSSMAAVVGPIRMGATLCSFHFWNASICKFSIGHWTFIFNLKPAN